MKWIIIVLGLLYILCFVGSCSGAGHAGHRGYSRGPSFFYFGGLRSYHGPSVRGGSVGGPSHRGGGIGSGK